MIGGSAVAAALGRAWRRWRSGSTDGQFAMLGALVLSAVLIFAGSLVVRPLFPPATYFLPLLVGLLALRLWPLTTLGAVVAVLALIGQTVNDGSAVPVVMLCIGIVFAVAYASRLRSGLPGTLNDPMLADLRDKLQGTSEIGTLPDGWRAKSRIASASGLRFSGDFAVSYVSDDRARLEIVLVDVSGKGVQVSSSALQLAGALGGLVGALPPCGVLAAANDFLLRQHWDEGFATAVHVSVDLGSGDYLVASAGHLPALRWVKSRRECEIDAASGTALGVTHTPEFRESRGTLGAGDALLLYTDGLVEQRGRELADGIECLRTEAAKILAAEPSEPERAVLSLARGRNDDRAVVLVQRV